LNFQGAGVEFDDVFLGWVEAGVGFAWVNVVMLYVCASRLFTSFFGLRKSFLLKKSHFRL
jgi:hypothetical protein